MNDTSAVNISFSFYQSFAYHASQIAKLTLAMAAILLNLLLCLVIIRTKTMHPNTKILIFGLGVSCTVRSMQQVIKTIFFLFLYHDRGMQGLAVTEYACTLIDLGYLIGFIGYLAFPLSLCIERAYACSNHQIYEAKKPVWGIFTVAVTLIAAGLTSASFLIWSNEKIMPYCDITQRSETDPVRTIVNVIIVGIYVSLVLGTSAWTARKAKKLLSSFGINQERLSLVSRLQLRHTIFVTKMMRPMILTQQFCLLVALVFIFLIGYVWKKRLSIPLQIILSDVGSTLTAVICFVLIPAICLTRNSLLWTETVKLIKRRNISLEPMRPPSKRKTAEEARKEQEAHFEAMENIWKQGPKLLRILRSKTEGWRDMGKSTEEGFMRPRYFPRKLSGANKIEADEGKVKVFGAGTNPKITKEDRKKRKDHAKELKRKKWRLIVRNLPFQCEKEDIDAVFKPFGELLEVVVPRKNERNAGFCFVQYRDFPSAAKAMKEQNMKKIKGRTVAIDWAVPKDDYMTAVAQEKSASENSVVDKDEDRKLKKDPEEKPEDSAEPSTSMDDLSISQDSVESDSEENSAQGDSDEQSDEEETEPQKSGLEGKNEAAKPDPGLTEGRTLFVRNLSFDTSDDDLKEFFQKFGEVIYAVVCKYADTEHSKGSGFVQFAQKADAEKCLEDSNKEHPDGTVGFKLDKRRLIVCAAVERGKAKEMEKNRHEKQPKDKRNLHLLRVGLIRQGTKQANNMSDSDAQKRLKIEQTKRQKIKNLHIFVSPTRLSVHNLPTAVDDRKLEKVCLSAVGDDSSAQLKECRVMRDLDRVSGSGVGKSKGYAFVEFFEHKHALKCLEELNNNTTTFTDTKRPIVEFSLENRNALNTKQKRLEKSKARLAAMKGEVPKKKQKSGKKDLDRRESFVEKKVTDLDETKKVLAAGGQKPMPSHLGPKIRHKKRYKQQKNIPKEEKQKSSKKDKKSRSERRKEKAEMTSLVDGSRKRKNKVKILDKRKKKTKRSEN